MSEEEKQVEVEISIGSTEEAQSKAQESVTVEEPKAKKPKASHTLKDALEQVEYFGQAVSEALQGRGNVVMVRVNDEALKHLDMLVEAEITKSRSESAAFLINEGIAANQELYGKISTITQKITELRDLLRQEVMHQPKEEPSA
ncbi:MAG: hypothetical protein MUF84_11500 [Anaerolineae bacterium]|jgi:hypothetical protein|nr:hypothetical protein [Anaerolineae bacterium]